MLQVDGVYSTARPLEALAHRARLHANPLPVEDLADRLGLTSRQATPYRRLSGGEQQRLKLALALVGRPELVFLDEPTAGLDPQSRLAVWDLIRELKTDGVSVLLTTHLMDEAEALADHITIIDHGRAVLSGTLDELTATDGHSSLTFQASPGLDVGALARAIASQSSLTQLTREEVLVTEDAPGRYRVAGAIEPATLSAITIWTAEQGEMLSNLATSRRSLEDVFLELTGRELRS